MIVIDDFVVRQMSGDPTYSNIPLLITFLKSYKRAYLGDAAMPDAAAANGGAPHELVPPELQAKFRQLFETYFSTAGKALVKGQTVSVVVHERRVKHGGLMGFGRRNCSSKIRRITRRISRPERYSRIGRIRMRG